jgi:hypothetical protein
MNLATAISLSQPLTRQYETVNQETSEGTYIAEANRSPTSPAVK